MKSTLDPEALRELLTAAESADMAGVAKRSWWRYVSSGRAPAPVRLGGAVRWRRSELAEWIAAGCPRVRKEVVR
jgi:predicted DNA-binding transcriptional regulator AlpA